MVLTMTRPVDVPNVYSKYLQGLYHLQYDRMQSCLMRLLPLLNDMIAAYAFWVILNEDGLHYPPLIYYHQTCNSYL